MLVMVVVWFFMHSTRQQRQVRERSNALQQPLQQVHILVLAWVVRALPGCLSSMDGRLRNVEQDLLAWPCPACVRSVVSLAMAP